MRFRSLTISNFRSIESLTIFCPELVVFVGPNNHGKSNILFGIEFFLNPGAKLLVSDCFSRSDTSCAVYVDATFEGLTEQERNTFRKYLREDGTVRIKKTVLRDGEDISSATYNGFVSEPVEPWLRESAVKELLSQDSLRGTPLGEYWKADGKLTQVKVRELQTQFINKHRATLKIEESLEETPLLGQKSVAGGVLPDFYLVPAVRDLSDEMKVKAGSSFGRLLTRAISDMAVGDSQFKKIKEQLDALVGSLNADANGATPRPLELLRLESALKEELKEWKVGVEIEVLAPDLNKIFELGTNIHIDDGVRTVAERKGHGLQRALVFGLLKAWAKTIRLEKGDGDGIRARKASDSLIFGIEEPELFLHPHGQRSFASALDEIVSAADHQVFLCTHSPHFVDVEKPRRVCLVSKSSETLGTTARQCSDDLFMGPELEERKARLKMTRWLNADRSEMFFASKVVFVEGSTEACCIPYLAERIGCLDPSVSLIDCGSKNNLPLFIRIANSFRLNYQVVYDEDPVSPDSTKEEKQTFALNREIEELVMKDLGKTSMISLCFEKWAGVSEKQGKRKGKPLAALEHFARIKDENIPDNVIAMVRDVFRR